MALLPLGTALVNAPSHSQLHRAWVDARIYSDLDTAIDEIGTQCKTLAIPAPTTLNRNGTVLSSTHLLFLHGGVVDTNSKTLTINGPINAPTSQIFAGNGTVSFGDGYTTEVHPQWWGADSTGSVECGTSIQRAVDSISSTGGRVLFTRGQYKIVNTITIGNSITLQGQGIGQNASRIYGTNMAGLYAFQNSGFPDTSNSQIVMRDLSIYGDYGQLAGAIRLRAYWSSLENIKVSGPDNTNGAVRLYYCQDIDLKHLVLLGHSSPGVAGSGYGLKLEYSNDIHGFVDVEGFTAGVWLDHSDNNHLVTRHEVNSTDGLVLDHSDLNWIKATFHNCPTQWLDLRGTSTYNHLYIMRGSDTNVPATPVLIDTQTIANHIWTKENYTSNTNDVFVYTDDELKLQKYVGRNFITFSDGGTSPSVDGGNNFKTGNTSPTTIDNLKNGMQGQPINIVFGDGNTTIDFTATNLRGNGGTNWTATQGDWMHGIFDGVDYYFDVHVT